MQYFKPSGIGSIIQFRCWMTENDNIAKKMQRFFVEAHFYLSDMLLREKAEIWYRVKPIICIKKQLRGEKITVWDD